MSTKKKDFPAAGRGPGMVGTVGGQEVEPCGAIQISPIRSACACTMTLGAMYKVPMDRIVSSNKT